MAHSTWALPCFSARTTDKVAVYEGFGLNYPGRVAPCERASLWKAGVQRLRERRERLDGKYIIVFWQVDL